MAPLRACRAFDSHPFQMRRIVRLLLLGLSLLQLAGCSPLFVLRAGYEEAKILSRRRSIVRLVEDPATPPAQREKLQLVLEVREFTIDSLHLRAGDSYTTFSQLDSDTLALVLSAARKDRFEPYTWWFPIIGRVPYRAYFSERSAEKAVRSLEAKGYDAYVRPTAAFSTLGWFNDPLVSTLLRYDSISLANTVVHEIFHNTLFLSGQVMFNESLANFVGGRGAVDFFCGAARPETEQCTRAKDAWSDDLLFGRFLSSLVDRLEALYAREDLSSEEKIAQREEIFEQARAEFEGEVRPRLKTAQFAGFARFPLNNASLIARRIYYERLDLFEEVYRQSGGELLIALERIMAAARASPREPFAAVERLLSEGAGGPRSSSEAPGNEVARDPDAITS